MPPRGDISLFFLLKVCNAAKVTVVESLLEFMELVLFGHPKAYLFLKSVRELMILVPQSAVYRQLEVSLDITSSSSTKVKLSVQF
jgi:hypothetical protein